MAEFYEGTLDTLMERLCGSISTFDREWVKRCVPATEEQIQQLQDILAEYHYTIPAAYLYFLRRMEQNDGGLLEREWDGCEVDIGTVLECLDDREDLEEFTQKWIRDAVKKLLEKEDIYESDMEKIKYLRIAT